MKSKQYKVMMMITLKCREQVVIITIILLVLCPFIGKVDKTVMKGTAMRANEARKKILSELQSSNEILPTDEDLKEFLKSKFIQILKIQ